ncbi:MAG: RNA-directed DNA polymerase [Ferruginibacter sp.]|nr:RNA-directed DNA polymerase [Ferruginibacter sp.]
MKRTNHILEQVADMDNLYLAFWKAKKEKPANSEMLAYQQQLQVNLLQLSNQVLTAGVCIGNYHYFKIYDPKERQICAAAFSERVLHHALMNICHDSFEKYQVYDSYASRKGKGIYAALERAACYQKKYKWYLKLDIRKYFDSINHDVLAQQLKKRFKEKNLLKIFASIINSYATNEKTGLPIGNLTSQYFANHYLAVSDHFIKEKLHCTAYVRYMDDMVLWDNCKEALMEKGRQLNNFIQQKLLLQLKLFCLNSTKKGLPFLGYLVFNDTISLNKNSRTRFIKKMKNYTYNLSAGLWSQQDYQRHVLPLVAFTQHANSFGFRKKALQQTEWVTA